MNISSVRLYLRKKITAISWSSSFVSTRSPFLYTNYTHVRRAGEQRRGGGGIKKWYSGIPVIVKNLIRASSTVHFIWMFIVNVGIPFLPPWNITIEQQIALRWSFRYWIRAYTSMPRIPDAHHQSAIDRFSFNFSYTSFFVYAGRRAIPQIRITFQMSSISISVVENVLLASLW